MQKKFCGFVFYIDMQICKKEHTQFINFEKSAAKTQNFGDDIFGIKVRGNI